jgi:putative ABC transport system substrate-binding protein
LTVWLRRACGGARGEYRRRGPIGPTRWLPSAYTYREHVEAGGLVSYSTNYYESFRRSATYVDKIFKGAKPGVLPIEQVDHFDLVINLKTARALGLTIPPSLLLRADQVIA